MTYNASKEDQRRRVTQFRVTGNVIRFVPHVSCFILSFSTLPKFSIIAIERRPEYFDLNLRAEIARLRWIANKLRKRIHDSPQFRYATGAL